MNGHHNADRNPLDYCIWDILQDLVYEGRRFLFASLQDLSWNRIRNQDRKPDVTRWDQVVTGGTVIVPVVA